MNKDKKKKDEKEVEIKDTPSDDELDLEDENEEDAALADEKEDDDNSDDEEDKGDGQGDSEEEGADDEESGEGEEDEDESEDKGDKKKELPSDKERLKEQRSENQLIREQNKVFSERLAQVGEIPEPTEDELKEYEPEWDELTPSEQRMTKRQWKTDKRAEQVHTIAVETKSDQDWNQKLDRFLDESEAKDQNEIAVENRDEFIKFATKKSHKGIPITVLADAFRARFNDANPAKQKKNTNLMERGGNRGVPPAPKGKTYTAEQIQNIREKDPAKYLELSKKGIVAKAMLADLE